LEWYFRLGSSNAHANEYQINSLPIPSIVQGPKDSRWLQLFEQRKWELLKEHLISLCLVAGQMPRTVTDALITLCHYIQQIEAERILSNRFERSQLAPESQAAQEVIDATFYRCYGFSIEESAYINGRLENML
jgi:hypothetical protein